MAGVPQRSVMAILGHWDPRMTMRYQHLTPEHLQDAMRALDRPSMGSSGTTVSEAGYGTIWALTENADSALLQK